jgi:hypothetical protein
MAIWGSTKGKVLNQGDFLPKIQIPSVTNSFPKEDESGGVPVPVIDADVIVVSQSCDLELHKVPYVVVAQIFAVSQFEQVNPAYKKKGLWKEVANGRMEALHLLASPIHPEDSQQCYVVDFRLIASLPIGFVENFAEACGDRWRLQPPYLESLSQAFGRFFMRVALPEPHAKF